MSHFKQSTNLLSLLRQSMANVTMLAFLQNNVQCSSIVPKFFWWALHSTASIWDVQFLPFFFITVIVIVPQIQSYFPLFRIYKLHRWHDIQLLMALHISNNVNKPFVAKHTPWNFSFHLFFRNWNRLIFEKFFSNICIQFDLKIFLFECP